MNLNEDCIQMLEEEAAKSISAGSRLDFALNQNWKVPARVELERAALLTASANRLRESVGGRIIRSVKDLMR